MLTDTNILIIIALMFWVLPWKGISLWYAARQGHKYWFVILLVLNTLAILDIIYIFAVARRKPLAAAGKSQPQACDTQ
jgi:hypothetical protein